MDPNEAFDHTEKYYGAASPYEQALQEVVANLLQRVERLETKILIVSKAPNSTKIRRGPDTTERGR